MAERGVKFLLLTWHKLRTICRLYQIIIEATQDLADLGQENVRTQASA